MQIDEYSIDNINQRGIYSITNLTNDLKYVGSTYKSFKERLTQHISLLNNNKHHCKHLQNAWNKYGETAFKFTVEEIIKDNTILLNRERYFIQLYDSYNHGYNENPDPNTSPMRNKSSCIKSSITHIQRWKKIKENMTDCEYQEYIHKIYAKNYNRSPVNKGKKAPKEWVEKMKKPKIHGVSEAMREVFKKNAELKKDRSPYILVYDSNKKWLNTFRCISDLIYYSESEYNNLPIILCRKGQTNKLDISKISNHCVDGKCYKGLFFRRVPKSWKLSYANRMNSWKAEAGVTMSQAESTLSEGAETTGEVKSS